MKWFLVILALGGALVGTALSVLAQGAFDLSWYTVDGGGGRSKGGPFALDGTIGQPDAGVHAGGDFALIGGFWGLALAAPSATASATAGPSPTASRTPTGGPSPTASRTPTSGPSPTATETGMATPTATVSPVASVTGTPPPPATPAAPWGLYLPLVSRG